jgi:hypothetical protein
VHQLFDLVDTVLLSMTNEHFLKDLGCHSSDVLSMLFCVAGYIIVESRLVMQMNMLVLCKPCHNILNVTISVSRYFLH